MRLKSVGRGIDPRSKSTPLMCGLTRIVPAWPIQISPGSQLYGLYRNTMRLVNGALSKGRLRHAFGAESEASLRRQQGSAVWRATWALRGRPCGRFQKGPPLAAPGGLFFSQTSFKGIISYTTGIFGLSGLWALNRIWREVMQSSLIRLMAAVAKWSVEGSMEVGRQRRTSVR